MTPRMLLCLAIASAVAGCAHLERLGLPRAACSANCAIDVEVTADANSCTFKVPEKNHEFRVAANTTTNITWRLTAPQGYQFAEPDGIRFTPPPPPNTFTRKTSANRQSFIFEDANNDARKKGSHIYHIKVENQNGSISCRLDPSVVNE